MTQRKSILSCFFILILAFLYNAGNTLSVGTTHVSGFHQYSISGHSANGKESVSIQKHTITKEKIKVRYKGGESPDWGFVSFIQVFPHLFIDCDFVANYSPFISTEHFSLFKLRGPPVILS